MVYSDELAAILGLVDDELEDEDEGSQTKKGEKRPQNSDVCCSEQD